MSSGFARFEPGFRISHLVAEALGSDDSDLITDTLVGLKVESKPWVVAFNYARETLERLSRLFLPFF